MKATLKSQILQLAANVLVQAANIPGQPGTTTYTGTNALQAEVVKLRHFSGMTNVEAAQALGLPERTAKYYWTHAPAWLIREMNAARAF